MTNIPRLVDVLLRPRGRVRGIAYWRAALLLLVVCFGLNLLWYFTLIGDQKTMKGNIANLAYYLRWMLIYPYFCLLAKRLHDSGKSAFWFILLVVLFLVFSFIAQAGITMYYLGGDYLQAAHDLIQEAKRQGVEPLGKGMSEGMIQQHLALRGEFLRKTYLPVIFVYMFFLSIFSTLVGLIRPKTQDNKYNPAADYD